MRGKTIDSQMECDIHGCCSVTWKGFKPRVVIPDCIMISDTGMQGDRQSKLRRAGPQDQAILESSQYRASRTKGTVTCLLLYSFSTVDGLHHPSILIVGSKPDQWWPR